MAIKDKYRRKLGRQRPIIKASNTIVMFHEIHQ